METYKDQLKQKIEGYKSYGQEVKDRLLAQLKQIDRKLTEAEYLKIKQNIPRALKSTHKLVVFKNKARRAVKGLERHRYAPELNTLHFKDGRTYRVGGPIGEEATLEWALEKYAKQNWFKSE